MRFRSVAAPFAALALLSAAAFAQGKRSITDTDL